jgi:hypothetical protein
MGIFTLTILRLLHIASGVFWAGAAIYLAAFILPASKALGPDGGRFMQQLANTNRLPLVMNLVSLTSIVTGLLLLWSVSSGFQPEWFGYKRGIILTLGSIAGIIAYLIGFTVNRPAAKRMAQLGKEIALAGGPPSENQQKEMAGIRQRMSSATSVIAWLLVLSVVAMSVIRYL